MIKILLLTCLLSINYLAEGKIYKWVDKNGTTHYSQTKPESTQSSEVNFHTTKPTSALPANDPEEESDRKKDTTYKLQKFAEQNQYRRDKEKARKRRCRKAKKSMKDLKASFNKRTTHSKTGGYIYPTFRENARIKAYQQEAIREKKVYVANACKRDRR